MQLPVDLSESPEDLTMNKLKTEKCFPFESHSGVGSRYITADEAKMHVEFMCGIYAEQNALPQMVRPQTPIWSEFMELRGGEADFGLRRSRSSDCRSVHVRLLRVVQERQGNAHTEKNEVHDELP